MMADGLLPMPPAAEPSDQGVHGGSTRRGVAVGQDFFVDISDQSGIRANNYITRPTANVPTIL